MKYGRFAAAALVVLLCGCFGPASGDIASIVIGTDAYGNDATVTFGTVDPSGEAKVLSGSIRNLTSEAIVITEVDVDNTVFSVTIPELPATIAANSSVSASIAFEPTDSGDAAADLTITIEGVDMPFTVHLSGEGNYAPVAKAAVTVSGAGTAAANGTYVKSDETVTTFNVYDAGLGGTYAYSPPVYELPGTNNLVWASDNDGGIGWVIDNDPDGIYYDDGYINVGYSYSLVAPSGNSDNGEWQNVANGDTPTPTVIGEIDAAYGRYTYAGDTVSANYLYTDAEDDAEGATTFQWIVSESIAGQYAPIPEERSQSYTVDAAYAGQYLEVIVTPAARSGFTTGEPVTLGPILVEELMY